MLVECRQCGAPLDVQANTSLVKCSYCGASSRVRSMRTIALEAPAGWTPPQTWTPPNQTAPLPYRAPPKQTSLRNLILAIVLLTVLLTLCPMLALPFIIAGGIGFG